MRNRGLQIADGTYRAEISRFGGGLWSLTRDGKPLLVEPPRITPIPFDAGCLLAPWPNRTEAGAYIFGGETHHLAITEPARQNAIHGFVRRLEWTAREETPNSVCLTLETDPQEGWPWVMRYEISWTLDAETGLTGEFRALNASDSPCPLGFGWHPYLSALGAAIDDCVIKLPTVLDLPLGESRKLPAGEPAPHAVFAKASHGGIPLRGQWFDNALRVVGESANPAANNPANRPENPAANLPVKPPVKPAVSCRLLGPDGNGVELWAGDWCCWLQVYTADASRGEAFPGVENGRALAIEPMSCPPNMLVSGVDLIQLAPGEARCFQFGLRTYRKNEE